MLLDLHVHRLPWAWNSHGPSLAYARWGAMREACWGGVATSSFGCGLLLHSDSQSLPHVACSGHLFLAQNTAIIGSVDRNRAGPPFLGFLGISNLTHKLAVHPMAADTGSEL